MGLKGKNVSIYIVMQGEGQYGEKRKKTKKDDKKSCRGSYDTYRSMSGDASWRLREEGEGAGNGHAVACLWRTDGIAFK